MSFKVLFLYPNLRSGSLIPSGIALLSRILKNAGIEVSLFDTTDYNLDPARDYEKLASESLGFRPAPPREPKNTRRDVLRDLNDTINSFGPNLIAMSCTESTFLLGIEMIRSIECREAPVVLGGIFATAAPARAISFPEIDIVCVGDGELPLLELCRRMERGEPFDGVPGLWLKGPNGFVRKNFPLPPVNLDKNPTDLDLGLFDPDRLFRPMDGRFYRMAPVETIRGCPYHCNFCNSPGQPVRKRSIREIHKELLYYKESFQIEFLFFWADTFLAMSARELDEFCEMYKDVSLPFWIQTRVETVTDRRLRKLKGIGLHKIAFGIENGDEEFRRRVMGKGFSNDDAIRKLRIVADLGILHNTNNMVGYPHETREIAMETVRLNTRFYGVDSVNCFTFAPYYGTKARNEAVRAGFMDPEVITPSNAEDSILNMPQFPRREIRGLRRCFALYVKFPESRWDEIRRAETDDDLFRELQIEYQNTFFRESVF